MNDIRRSKTRTPFKVVQLSCLKVKTSPLVSIIVLGILTNKVRYLKKGRISIILGN